ncbi:hypothetical protein BDW02DRAFT_120468 [Decorospora gaudefroyi]|uniref:F-box domain-containing protein n=1 Tax=Decorospora gaudefroyi TaxID=184978 RepID=A0A6A5KVB2_9PLEO|nr:hypothetical protein BDW02DRAFT_120468 [Decorospora gaudefroyi]
MTSPVSSSPLLQLPRELRYEIYDLLCRQEPKSYPFRQPPISSIDRRAPPTPLLIACRYLYEEIRTYFLSKVTLRFVAQEIPRRDVDTASLTAVRQAKKVELRLYWHLTPKRKEMDMSTWPYSMTGWLTDAVDMLVCEAKSLEGVTVSVMDLSQGVEWECKKTLLAPLQRLRGRARLRVGEVVEWEEATLRKRLEGFVRKINSD